MNQFDIAPGISPVSPEEFPAVVEVWEKSVRATHDFLEESDIARFRPLILNEFLHAVALRCVRYTAGDIAGFVGVADGKVEMLFLAPEVMGQGLGKRLLLHAVHEMGATQVDVNEQNPAATAFYRRCGFEVVGRTPVDGMGKPFPLLRMKWRGAA